MASDVLCFWWRRQRKGRWVLRIQGQVCCSCFLQAMAVTAAWGEHSAHPHPVFSSKHCTEHWPLTAATASSACKTINWAISSTLIILGCCLLRLVLKLIQDIIYTISCKVRHAFFFYQICQRCRNKPSVGKGIIVFMQTVIMLVTPATLLSLLPVTH